MHKIISEKLAQFNNMSLTKKQWDIVLKGCGCPKSIFFWTAIRENNMLKNSRIYTLINIDENSVIDIIEKYKSLNNANSKNAYAKSVAKKKARTKIEKFKGITFYIVNGVATTEKPEFYD